MKQVHVVCIMSSYKGLFDETENPELKSFKSLDKARAYLQKQVTEDKGTGGMLENIDDWEETSNDPDYVRWYNENNGSWVSYEIQTLPLESERDQNLLLVSFTYGDDTIDVYESPDENAGYINGWMFVFNENTDNEYEEFYSCAGGSEGLTNYAAEMYAKYLATIKGEIDLCINDGEPDGTDTWQLNEELFLDFTSQFESELGL